MKVLATGKNLIRRLIAGSSVDAAQSCAPPRPRYKRNAGNIFFALFAAVGMVGAIGYGFNEVIKGPITGVTEVTRRTVAENTAITSSRLAIVGATTQQTLNGDCDLDGMVEPLPYRAAGGGVAPIGGGYLPTGLLPNSIDPWNTEYGYCAWDHGSVSVSNAVAACGGASPRRLQGSPLPNQYAIAIISAGKDRTFQTRCNAYVDTTPADGKPDTPLLQKPAGSDDVVLGYTYAEANNLGNGLWKLKSSAPTIATTNKNLEVGKDGSFSEAVVLEGNTVTGGGLILPSDPGNNSITGACSAVNQNQLRFNVGTGTDTPVIEICDFGGLGWAPISGGAGDEDGEGGGATTGQLVANWKMNEASGTMAYDSVGTNDGALVNSPVWAPSEGRLGGMLNFPAAGGSAKSVRVPRSAALEPTQFSISLWVKPDSTQDTTNRPIFIKGHSSTRYSGITLSSGYYVQFHTGNTGGRHTNSSDDAIPTGQWTLITVTYDPSLPTQQKKIYLNGVLETTTTESNALVYETTAAGDIFMGAYGSDNYRGGLDDVRFYNYALTPENIAKLYQDASVTLNTKSARKPGTIYGWGTDTNGRLGNGTSVGNHVLPSPYVNGESFLQVETSDRNTCGLKADGTVWCVGSDASGQIGNGATTTGDQHILQQASNLNNVIQISVSSSNVCALKSNGTAWCWGANGSGQLGTESITPATSTAPVQVKGITDFIFIASGGITTCGIRHGGAAFCWGEGSYGQLGNGLNTDSLTPVRVSNINDFVTLSPAGGDLGFCGTTRSGKGYCWGNQVNYIFGNGAGAGVQSTPSQISNITDFVKIVLNGWSNGCGLRGGGEIWCWGTNLNGELGNGTTSGTATVPAKIINVDSFIDVGVSLGMGCGIQKNGDQWCWGMNSGGELGAGPSVTAPQGTPVKTLGGNYIATARGAGVALVDPTPSKTTNTGTANGKLAAGIATACTIKSDGSAWCWGRGNDGQLGNGTNTAIQTSPVRVLGDGTWTQISVGQGHTCGIKNDGVIYCWGSNTYGELGTGGSAIATPTAVSSGTDKWSYVSAGNYHTCGIKTDGSAWCWGQNGGKLGTGGGNLSTPTTPVAGNSKWKIVKAALLHSCGIKSDGSAWCWGQDANGKLGDGSPVATQATPVQVLGGGNWVDITTGPNNSCGIKTDGSAWCWGLDTSGQIGNGPTITADQHQPSLVADQGSWKKISMGYDFTCGIKIDGSAWCWGLDTNGRLGNGATLTANQNLPTPILGSTQWSQLATGTGFGCVMKADQSISCWGMDGDGQIGNGGATAADQPSPVPITNPKTSFVSADASANRSASAAQANMAIGTTYISDAEGASQGLQFAGSGQSILRQGSAANQLMLETSEFGGSAQIGLKNTGDGYFVGYNGYTGGVEFGVGNSAAHTVMPSFEVSNEGFVGIGTGGEPVAKLDVRGAIRLGDAGATCNASVKGTMKYAGSKVSFCDGADWVDVSEVSGGGGGGEPVLPWDLNFSSVVIGSGFSCALKSNGKAYCWGFNGSGQLGNGNTGTNSSVPVAVSGTNLFTQLAAGTAHACGITADGSAYCWGYNNVNQLGNGGNTTSNIPVTVNGVQKFKYISSNGNHTCGINSAGAAYCWGQNSNGQLGNGNTTNQSAPALVTGSHVWSVIAPGRNSTCGIRADGNAYCWGEGTSGQIGNGSNSSPTSPTAVSGGHKFISISTNVTHSCGVRVDGAGYCWGGGTDGRTGMGGTGATNVPTAITGSHSFKSIETGSTYTCAIRTDGDAYCWGQGTNGKLGNGGTSGSNNPVAVSGGLKFISIDANHTHTCAITASGGAYCWGLASYGAMGNNTTTPDLTAPGIVTEPAP